MKGHVKLIIKVRVHVLREVSSMSLLKDLTVAEIIFQVVTVHLPVWISLTVNKDARFSRGQW